jgi:hypothetical protein
MMQVRLPEDGPGGFRWGEGAVVQQPHYHALGCAYLKRINRSFDPLVSATSRCSCTRKGRNERAVRQHTQLLISV